MHLKKCYTTFIIFLSNKNEHNRRSDIFLKELCLADNLNDNHREKLREARNVIEMEYEDYKKNETMRAVDIINKLILDETNDFICRIEKTDRLSHILVFLVSFKNLVLD